QSEKLPRRSYRCQCRWDQLQNIHGSIARAVTSIPAFRIRPPPSADVQGAKLDDRFDAPLWPVTDIAALTGCARARLCLRESATRRQRHHAYGCQNDLLHEVLPGIQVNLRAEQTFLMGFSRDRFKCCAERQRSLWHSPGRNLERSTS